MSFNKDRRTSFLWKYYKRGDKFLATCKKCKKEISYRTSLSNLKKHLQRIHPGVSLTKARQQAVTSVIIGSPRIEETAEDSQLGSREVHYTPGATRPSEHNSTGESRNKSFLWQYFQPVDDVHAKCMRCQKHVSYKTSITNLKKHMLRMHPAVHLKTARPAVIYADFEPLPVVETADEVQPGSHGMNDTLFLIGRSQQTPNSVNLMLGKTESRKKSVMDQFLKLFYIDLQPFSIVDKAAYRDFFHVLNPTFKMPDRKTLSNTLIPEAYERCCDNVKEALKEVQRICLTTDAWTSTNGYSFIAVTGHFITKNFDNIRVMLKCKEVTSNLASDFKEVITEWNLKDKVILVVTDNNPDTVSAVEDILKLKYFGCFAYTLNAIVKGALQNSGEVDGLIGKVRAIVDFFSRSAIALTTLTESENNFVITTNELEHDEETRWNSTYYMIERFVEMRQAVTSALDLSDDFEVVPLNEDEWELLKEVLMVLKPFESATKAVSGDKYMPASTAIIVTNGIFSLCSNLSPNHPEAQKVLKDLQAGLRDRMGNVEDDEILACCTFLDPRFKTYGFKSKSAAEAARETVIGLVSQEIKKSTPLSTTLETRDNLEALSIFSVFRKKIAVQERSEKNTSRSKATLEVQRYMEESVLDLKCDPCVWWKENHLCYPNLSRVVRDHFCAVVTSAPCERLFSNAKDDFIERRSRVSNEHVSKIIFLKENSSMNCRE